MDRAVAGAAPVGLEEMLRVANDCARDAERRPSKPPLPETDQGRLSKREREIASLVPRVDQS